MKALVLLVGIVSFALYVIYDVDSVKKINKIFHSFFAIGTVLLILSTTGLIILGILNSKISLLPTTIFLSIALLFLILLIYTLFFSLPFKEIYVDNHQENKKRICSTGMYGLCRHPGVLWFSGFYICLAIAIPSPLLIGGATTFVILNILYVVFQDFWTFSYSFLDYNLYRKEIPFLIPTGKSIRYCIKTMKGKVS